MDFVEIAQINSNSLADYYPALSRFATNRLPELVTAWLDEIADGARDFGRGAVKGSERQLILYKDSWVAVGLRALPCKPSAFDHKTLATVPMDVANFVVSDGELTVDEYALNRPLSGTVAESGPALTFLGKRIVKRGEMFEVRRTAGVADIAQVRGKVVLLEISLGKPDSVVWHFKKETLEPLYCTASDSQAKRSQLAMRLLRDLDPELAASVCADVVRSSEHHFVRWEAMRMLASSGHQATYEELHRLAANDPHPQVRQAAQKALALREGR